MKLIIIIFLLFVVGAFVTARYRKQINAAILAWRSLASGQPSDHPATYSTEKSVELIKCEKCGSWTPQTSALLLNSGEMFCSTDCINEAILIKKGTAV